MLIESDAGNIELELFPSVAPKHVAAFLTLTRRRFYDGVGFHRVVPGFVIQGGCPIGDGTGGPGYTLPAEFSKLKHERGTLSMARRGHDVNSAGSQFFICLSRERCEALDGQYTIFGRVTSGMATVDKIAAGELLDPARGVPVKTIKIRRVAIVEPPASTQPSSATKPSAHAGAADLDIDADPFLATASKLLAVRNDALVVAAKSQVGPGGSDPKFEETPATQSATDPDPKVVAANEEQGAAYRKKIAALPGVKTTKSGVLVRELRAGDGKYVRADGSMTCHYAGKLIDGTVFDSSYKRQQPAVFEMAQLIRGYQDAAPYMRVGGKYQLVVPPDLGYGLNPPANSGIGPNATLDFTVEVLDAR